LRKRKRQSSVTATVLPVVWTLYIARRFHDEDHANYLNSMWLIAITLLSVGYGDIVPNTYCGRGITLSCGIMVRLIMTNTYTIHNKRAHMCMGVYTLTLHLHTHTHTYTHRVHKYIDTYLQTQRHRVLLLLTNHQSTSYS